MRPLPSRPAASRWPFPSRALGARLGAGLAACLLTAPLAAQSAPADTGRFEAEIASFEAGDRATPPAPGGVLFVGSSSIRLWETLERDFPGVLTLNRGFGGSETSDLLHYAERVVLPYRPRTIVLYEGDNDLASGKSPARVLDDVGRFVDWTHARLPGTRILLLSVKPSLARVALLPQQAQTNAGLRALAASDSLVGFVDVFTPMLDASGRPRPELFGPDGLHMTAEGYAVWTRALTPYLGGAAPPARLPVQKREPGSAPDRGGDG